MATPKKEKPKESPGYVKAAMLAKLFGESTQWIGQLKKNGILKEHKTDAGMRYHAPEATRDYIAYLRERAAGRKKNLAGDNKEKEKLEAEVRLKSAKADVAELDALELQGQMHRSEDVEAMTTDLVYTIRGMLIALPGRIAVDVATIDDVKEAETVIRKEVEYILTELSQYKYDPRKYEKRVRERKKWADMDEDTQ